MWLGLLVALYTDRVEKPHVSLNFMQNHKSGSSKPSLLLFKQIFWFSKTHSSISIYMEFIVVQVSQSQNYKAELWCCQFYTVSKYTNTTQHTSASPFWLVVVRYFVCLIHIHKCFVLFSARKLEKNIIKQRTSQYKALSSVCTYVWFLMIFLTGLFNINM